MAKVFNKFKTLFLAHSWSIFPIFGAHKFFTENPALSHTTLSGSLGPCQNLEKTKNKIRRRCLDRWKDEGMERWKDFFS